MYNQKFSIMKLKKFLIPVTLMLGALILSHCTKENPEENNDESILPGQFKVDIPSSISNDGSAGTRKKSTHEDDTVSGDDLYEHLTNFIALGEASADLVEDIILAIALYDLDQPMEFSYEGDDDGRTKNLVIVENSTYEGNSYQYQMDVTDADSEENEDGGIAMQIFWNNSPIEGVALLKPYNIDRTGSADAGDAVYKLEYSESTRADNLGYDAIMIVTIVDIPLADPAIDQFAIDNLKMFAGKKGDIVDVYGNSNHPNAFYNIDDELKGLNWAFVASGNKENDYGVAEVGLPKSSADISTRSEILEDNSIKAVWTNLMTTYIVDEYAAVGITLQPSEVGTFIQPYLQNADAPGYFDNDGFIQGGTSPGNNWNDLVTRLQDLSPYNPKEVSELTVFFKE
jgi:hypothetical protein